MAEQAITRLTVRTGRSYEEVTAWLTEALAQLEYPDATAVPKEAEEAVLAYTEYVGFKALAAAQADAPNISLKGFGISKGNASNNLDRVAKDAYRRFIQLATKAGVKIPTGPSVASCPIVRADGR